VRRLVTNIFERSEDLSGVESAGARQGHDDLSDVQYLFHDRTIIITSRGRICIGKRKINLSHASAGQTVGVTEVSEKIWLVSFMNHDLGFFDHESGRVECAENPFGAKVLPHVTGTDP
jgi:putative transposase